MHNLYCVTSIAEPLCKIFILNYYNYFRFPVQLVIFQKFVCNKKIAGCCEAILLQRM